MSPTVPKLDKASPYEFIQAWNSLKSASGVQAYTDLLQQIQPVDLPRGKFICCILCLLHICSVQTTLKKKH